MPASVSSGNTSVTGTVTSTPLIHTLSALSGSVTNTTTTMGTVGAGKKWTIISVQVSAYQLGANTNTTDVRFNDVVFFQAAVQSTAGLDANVTERIVWGYNDGPKLTAGQTVKMVGNSATGNAYVTVTYVEEAA